ncbi:peptide-binding protein [Hoyosella sp. G463]|uniref:Peptide-binding protein n=1 Tax=Lolliginicoccus lacisalsi TaxID=2742202 RepID=A0A927J9Z2_9ACTN|nr:ABC transporter substrate-binding protein [Lolliginicoccus lacisalsi]MBD8505319.1 peptide-binding protein [Lolliginicoccus lacisalsi]
MIQGIRTARAGAGPARRRAAAVVSVATAAIIPLSACATVDTLDEYTLGYAIDAPITTYNANTVDGAYSAAPAVLGRVLTGLSYIGPEGTAVFDRDLGTITPVPGSPEAFDVTLDADAVFSDGIPITCNDLVLAWAAGSGRFTGPGPDGGDPEPLFDAATDWGFADIEAIDCEPGSKSAQVRFREGRVVTDWAEIFAATTIMPSHVVAREARVPDLVGAVARGDIEALARIAEFWNTGWDLEPGEIDLTLYPSSGPYRIESFTEDGGLLLVRNDRWWGDPPRTPRIVVWPGMDTREIVARGEAQIVEAGAGSVPGLDLAGYDARTVASRNTEQLVFNTRGVFGNVDARRAFTGCVPRQRVADDAINSQFGDSPPQPGVVSSRIMQPGHPAYGYVAGPAQQIFLQPDLELARNFPQSDDMRVRIGYRGPDQRREETVSFIARSCQEAGIIVQNVSSRDFDPARAMEAGEVDIVLGGVGGVQSSGGLASEATRLGALHSRNGRNIGAFSQDRIDILVAELAAISNPDARYVRFAEAESILWSELPSVPLAVQPRTVAHAESILGVVPNPSRAGVGWNMDKWVRG